MQKQQKDIRYRGPMSYRHLRMIALLVMTVSQVSVLINAANGVGMYLMGKQLIHGANFALLADLGAITFPLLLITSFAEIVRNEENIVRIMIVNLILAIGVSGAIILFVPDIVRELVLSTPQVIGAVMKESEFVSMLQGKLTAIRQSLAQMSPEELASLEQIPILQQVAQLTGYLPGEALAPLLELVTECLQRLLPLIVDSPLYTAMIEGVADYAVNSVVPVYANLNVPLDLFLCSS